MQLRYSKRHVCRKSATEISFNLLHDTSVILAVRHMNIISTFNILDDSNIKKEIITRILCLFLFSKKLFLKYI